MKLSQCLSTLIFLTLLNACSTTPHAEFDALKSAQLEARYLLAYQAEELKVQRQQLVQLQTRNSELTEVLFDLRQELETVNQEVQRVTRSSADSPSRKKARSSAADAASLSLPLVDESGKVILGTAEWVWFDVLGRSVQAKIDDQSKSSSIRAYDIQLFERDGDEWVRFALAATEPNGADNAPAIYEAPLLRKVRVRTSGGDETESRPVVRLKVKLGELIDNTEFTLVNRDTAAFSVVLGRSFLRDIAVVDEERQYTQPTHPENSQL
jgi:hypothetical protein